MSGILAALIPFEEMVSQSFKWTFGPKFGERGEKVVTVATR